MFLDCMMGRKDVHRENGAVHKVSSHVICKIEAFTEENTI